MKVRVDGQLVLGTATFRLMAVRAGFGLAYLPGEEVRRDRKAARLIRVLADWCPPFSGYHLYYSGRRQPTQAFALLVEALRYRAP